MSGAGHHPVRDLVALATLAAASVLALCATAGAAEGPARPAEPLRFRLGVNALSGYPDVLGIQLGLWMPNRFQVEIGASAFVSFRSAHARVGFPWTFPAGRVDVALSPAVGVRWEQGEQDMELYGCFGGDEECTETIQEWSLLGVNAVLGLDWVRMVAAHLGAFFQIVGGATVRVAGFDDDVETTSHDDADDSVVRKDRGRVRPDVRFAFGFVF